MLITPQKLEQAAKDIVDFWEKSELPNSDKQKILEMVRDFYGDRNETLIDQYLGGLTERTIIRHTSETGFEHERNRS